MAPPRRPLEYTILIADDDPTSRDDLQAIVRPQGFPTFLAESGEEALDIIQSQPVHLLLCDMHMPRLSGLETVNLAHQFNQLLPCILVTAAADDRLIRQALQVKVYSVLAKPVNRHELLYTLTRALRKTYEQPPFSPS